MSPRLIYFVVAVLSAVLIIRLASHGLSVRPYPSGTSITFQTQVSNQPKISANGQKISLILPNNQRVTLRLELNPLISYGDQVKLEGRIEYFESPDGDQIAFMNYPKLLIIKKGNESNLILKVRENIINFFNSALGPSKSSLMLGIVFGIKEEMNSKFYLNLQNTGLLHVIAASGMNITMVGGFLASLFALFLRRQVALIFSILGIFFYAALAGFEPSIVRASVMGILVFSAQIIGRQSYSFLGLFLAGFFMLFLSPELILDIGFQLSFMASFGLIYFSPLFYQSLRMKKLIEKSLIGGDFVTTVTAQIFTLPILLINFGNYSIISILVNGILLWTIPIIMVIGGLSALLGLLIEPLGRLILYFSLPFLIYFEAVVNWLGSDAPQIGIEELPASIMAGYYLILFSVIMFVRKKISK